jgi:hypothetical protein
MTAVTFGGYGTSTQTLTAVSTGVTANPELITTAVRTAYTAGAVNPGVVVMQLPDVNTTYTISAWVYNEGPSTEDIALALKGSSSGGQQTVPVGVWKRLSWTMTTPASLGTGNDFGVRISVANGTGSFLTTGVLIEKTNALGNYFDGTTPASENLVKGVAATMQSQTTAATGVSYAGQTWVRATTPIGPSANAGIVRQFVNLADIVNGETYTVSVTVANDQAFSQNLSLDWCDQNYQYFTIAPGEVRRILVTASKSVYDSVFRFADLQVTQSPTEARSILFKDWLIERGTTTGEYYTGTGDFTYSWSGTVNASSSLQRASAGVAYWAPSSTAMTYQSNVQKYISGKSAAVITKGGNGDGLYAADISSITPGGTYTFSAWVKTTTSHPLSIDLRWKDSAQTILSDTIVSVSPVVGTWTRVSATAVAPTGSVAFLQPMIRIYAAHTATTFFVDDALVEYAGYVGTYFDGSTAASGDFTYAWAGTVNASMSYQQAPVVNAWLNRWFGSTGGAGSLYQAKGGPSGTYARKLWTQANTGSSMDTGINTGNITAWASTPYTLSAWVRCSVDQVYQFYIDWKDSGGTVISSSRPTQTATIPANTWTRIAISATSPVNTAMATFVLTPYNGATAMPAGATMDFDNAMAEMYPSVRDYFDANNPIKNLCTNPSFDTDTSGWTATLMAASHGRSVTRSWVGGSSLWGSAVDNQGDSMYTNTTAYDVNEGATYTVSAYVWVPAGVLASEFRNGNRNLWAVAANGGTPSLVGTANIDFAKTNQWQRLSTTLTIPAGSNKLNVRLYFPANAVGIWWDAVLVEKTDVLNPYYAGQGGFTYAWSGPVNASSSLQQAPKPSTVGAANQAVVYQVGTTGKFKNRVSFTGNTVTDSGVNFGGGIVTAPNKTYTLSAIITADSNRTFRWSAQGAGVVFGSSGTINLTAGVPLKSIWSFTTAASGTFALYMLRADTLLGNIDMESIVVEEGTALNGGYFNGARVDANLVTNSNFEVDTTGWWPNTGTPTITASTDRTYLGTKSLKAVSTVASADIATTITLTLKPSTTYTMSYYVNSPDARNQCYFDVAATNYSVTRLGQIAVAANTWTRVSATFTTPENLTGTTSFYFHHSGGPTTIGTAIYMDCVLLEETDTLNQYYEGAGDFTYAWTGTAHASTSVQRGVAVSRVGSERAFGISTTRNGDKVVRVIPSSKGNGSGFAAYTGSDVFINLASQPASLKPNTTYTVTSTYAIESPLSLGGKFRFNIDGLDQYSPSINTAVGEYTMNWTFTTGASGLISFLRFMPGPSGVAGYTNEVILKNFMLTEGTYIGPYFDGATTAGDFTYRWTGTANGSASDQRATPPLKIGGLNGFPATSTEWGSSGTKSIRITPTGLSTDSFAYLTLPPLENRTYTLMATMRMAAPQTGSPDVRARRLDVFHSNGYTLSAQAPNVSGVYKHRVTFTVTDKTAYTNARLYNGASVGNGDVWWDDIMLVEGTYEGDFINPVLNPLAKWDGTAHDSTSVGYSPQLLDIAGKPFRDITTSTVIPNAGHVPDMGPRTVYVVYDAFGYTASYNGIGYYGDSVNGGRITFQTAASGQNLMGVRLDFTNGESNKVFSFTGGRSNRRHVLAMTISNGLTSFTGCLNGAADQTAPILGGTGWNSNYTSLSANSEITGIRMFVFYAEHDRNTRVAMSRYLGNKYGAYVS